MASSRMLVAVAVADLYAGRQVETMLSLTCYTNQPSLSAKHIEKHFDKGTVMKKILMVLALVAMTGGSAWAGDTDNADTIRALELCQAKAALANVALGLRHDIGANQEYILTLGEKAAQGDYFSYSCAIKFINAAPDTLVARMLRGTIAIEQNRLILEALKKK